MNVLQRDSQWPAREDRPGSEGAVPWLLRKGECVLETAGGPEWLVSSLDGKGDRVGDSGQVTTSHAGYFGHCAE